MAQLRRGYKVRHYVSGTGKDGIEYKNYSITVPSEIAEALPKGIQFLPRMTDQGLLFEPVDRAKINLPNWAKENENSNPTDEEGETKAA